MHIPGGDSPTVGEVRLVVASFNILAEGLAEFGGFPRAKLNLRFLNRLEMLLQCIARANADVLCLQEACRFEDCLAPALETMGYQCHFVSGGASPAVSSGVPQDGIALCVRTSVALPLTV